MLLCQEPPGLLHADGGDVAGGRELAFRLENIAQRPFRHMQMVCHGLHGSGADMGAQVKISLREKRIRSALRRFAGYRILTGAQQVGKQGGSGLWISVFQPVQALPQQREIPCGQGML